MKLTETLVLKYFALIITLTCFTGSAIAVPGFSASGSLATKINFNQGTYSDLNRAAYYKAMGSDNKALVDEQIAELNSAPADIKNAFLGAMIMRKAGIGGSPASKLKLFKQGHKLLEDAIKHDPNNPEYRLLRLMIQENAPGILGYKNDKEKDSEFIRKYYKSLPEDLQKAIADYNKKSKVLKLQVS